MTRAINVDVTDKLGQAPITVRDLNTTSISRDIPVKCDDVEDLKIKVRQMNEPETIWYAIFHPIKTVRAVVMLARYNMSDERYGPLYKDRKPKDQ